MIVGSQRDTASSSEDAGGTPDRPAVALPRRVLFSPWLPVALAAALAAVWLRFYGVPLPTTAAFAAYIVLGLAVPGTLIWRACGGGSGWLGSDLAGGLVVGYSLEVLTYIGARWIGQPRLVLVWPILTIAAFLAVPALRRHWRGSGLSADRTPTWVAWVFAAIVAVFLLRSTRFSRGHLLEWPFTGATDADSPFHLALIGEAKHHMPLMTPWVSDERFIYHWFVYPEMAATSWITGIEPLLLLFRLSLIPMFVAFLVLIGAIARKLTAVWWAAPVAALATYLVIAPDPYGWDVSEGWFGFSSIEDGSVFRLVTWTSPTQTFGALIFAAVILVLVRLLAPGRSPVSLWVLFALMLCSLAGAKSPYLPLLLGGLGLLIAVGLVTRRARRLGSAAIAAGMVFAATVLAQIVLYGGSTQLLSLDPLRSLTWFGTRASTVTGFLADNPPLWRLLVMLAITVLCWLFMWFGSAGLVLRRHDWHPALTLLIGLGVVGLTGFLTLSHPGGAEGYLVVSARPYLAVAAVAGVAAAIQGVSITARTVGFLAGTTVLGAATVWSIRALGDSDAPQRDDTGSYVPVAWALVWPYLALTVVAALAGLAVFLLRRRVEGMRRLGLATLVAIFAGFSLPTVADQMTHTIDEARFGGGWRRVSDASLLWQWDKTGDAAVITRDIAAAGRWLREHSEPGDLIATNVHCLPNETGEPPCDNRHFAIAAMSERRVLVEGWGFTNSVYLESARSGAAPWFAAYWDPQRLADNDAAFQQPSPDTVGRLADEYGVRWLLADSKHRPISPDIGRYASLRHVEGDCAVYEIVERP